MSPNDRQPFSPITSGRVRKNLCITHDRIVSVIACSIKGNVKENFSFDRKWRNFSRLPAPVRYPSSKVTAKVPRSPAKNSRRVAAFVSTIDSMTTLPVESMTATEMVAWCTSSPIYTFQCS